MILKLEKFVFKYAILLFFIIFCTIISIIEPRFLALNNLINVFRQTSVNAVIAAGMTLVILTGGIDLSVGSIFALSSALGAFTLIGGSGSIPAIIVSIVTGIILGSLNGVFVVYFKIQAFIATLVTMTLARGITYIVTNGIPATIPTSITNSGLFSFVGEGYILGIPSPVIIMVVLYSILYWVLHQTKYGRYIYAVGGSEKSAVTAGVPVAQMKFWVYIISGACAALAGLILTSRLGSAPPTAGSGYELDAIAAVVLGGTSLNGGRGSILKSMLGALIIAILGNTLNLLNVSAYYQMVVKALVILLAVLSTKQ
ncbi:MAG: ABC transporter permease subunit [Brevinema sp.]